MSVDKGVEVGHFAQFFVISGVEKGDCYCYLRETFAI